MTLPFSRQQFFDVIARYNEAVWPAQIALFALALGVAIWVLARRGHGRVIGWLLASLWAWMAVAYHFAFFSAINPAAWLFGAAFLGHASLSMVYARALRFESVRGADRVAGVVLIAYGLIGYPILGWLVGHAYPHVPTFGLPCPTTILTLGVLLLAQRPVPAALFAVPLALSAVGSVAAFQLGVPQDFGLLVAGLITVAVLGLRALRARTTGTLATGSHVRGIGLRRQSDAAGASK
jgi:hypothetical protein